MSKTIMCIATTAGLTLAGCSLAWGQPCADVDLSTAPERPGGGSFRWMNSEYPFITSGRGVLMGNQLPGPKRFCMQYRVTNTGSDIIERFRWELGRILRSDLAPGTIEKSIKFDVYSCHSQIEPQRADIGAFRSARAVVETQSPIRPSDRPEDLSCTGQVEMAHAGFLGGDTLRLVAESLPREGFDASVLSYRFAGDLTDDFSLVPLTTTFTSESFVISVRSTATYVSSDRVVILENSAEVTEAGDVEISIMSPFLAAVEEASVFDDVSTSTDRFLAAMEGYSGAPVGEATSYLWSEGYPVRFETNQPSTYVAEFPLTVRIGESIVCIVAQAYSNVPVSTSDERYCGSEQ